MSHHQAPTLDKTYVLEAHGFCLDKPFKPTQCGWQHAVQPQCMAAAVESVDCASLPDWHDGLTQPSLRPRSTPVMRIRYAVPPGCRQPQMKQLKGNSQHLQEHKIIGHAYIFRFKPICL